MPAMEIPTAWIRMIRSRPLAAWKDVRDDELPIPIRFISDAAYFLYAERGGIDGFDVDHWLEAEMTLRGVFRESVDALLEADAAELELLISPGDEHQESERSGPMAGTGLACATKPQSVISHAPRRWTNKPGSVKMGNMGNIDDLTPSEACALREQHAGYHDALGEMGEEQRRQYRGKVLAIASETGEIIAFADSRTELRVKVQASRFRDRYWRVADGPTGDEPLPREEAERDRS